MINESTWKRLAALLVSVAVLSGGCGRSDDVENEHSEACAHEEEGAGEVVLVSESELLSARCEHDMQMYQCDECRYELGIVKLESALLKNNDSQSAGLVAMTTVAKSVMPATVDVTGEIRLNENATVHVTPRVAGIVRSVNVDLGDRVSKDDVLFGLDSIELGATFTEYIKHESLVSLSGKNLEREKKLRARDISSERELIEAQIIFEEHQANLNAVRQKLHVLGLSEKEIAARSDMGDDKQETLLPVCTSIDGTIIERHVVVGELIEPGDDVMLVSNLETLWVWADVYENDLASLMARKAEGGRLSVEVRVQAFPERVFPGFIDYIGVTMDERTRTVKARAILENKDHFLRPGMFCSVKIAIGADKEVLVIPASALLSDEGAEFVFTHFKDDLYLRRPVVKGCSVNGLVEIESGLAEGETIVSDGCFLLKSDVLREKMGAGCAD